MYRHLKYIVLGWLKRKFRDLMPYDFKNIINKKKKAAANYNLIQEYFSNSKMSLWFSIEHNGPT